MAKRIDWDKDSKKSRLKKQGIARDTLSPYSQTQYLTETPRESRPLLIALESLYTSPKDITKALRGINKEAVTKLGLLEFQRSVCSAIQHLVKHRDIRVIRQLLDSFPEAFPKRHMVAFIGKFAPVSFDDAGQANFCKTLMTAFRQIGIAPALRTPWWECR